MSTYKLEERDDKVLVSRELKNNEGKKSVKKDRHASIFLEGQICKFDGGLTLGSFWEILFEHHFFIK